MLSAVIITKNESSNIEDCLRSLAFANQRVVLDGGSTDQTCEIAQRLGAEVFVNSDWQGFGVQKNRAIAHATHEWVLVVDADERVSPALASEILSVVQQNSGPDAYYLPRCTLFYGLKVKYGGFEPDHGSVRLFRRQRFCFNEALVHEKIDLKSKSAGHIKEHLIHLSYVDPDVYLKKLAAYSKLAAEDMFQRGKRANAYAPFIHAVAAFFKSFIWKRGLLDGSAGLLIASMHAEHTYHKYFQLFLMSSERHSSN
jgi:glycosyltransferase involved in cell wall biosynthesis